MGRCDVSSASSSKDYIWTNVVDEYAKYDLHHLNRVATKTGLMGLWQVSGRSGIVDFEEEVRLDTEYISTWKPWLDVRIIWETVRVAFSEDGAK